MNMTQRLLAAIAVVAMMAAGRPVAAQTVVHAWAPFVELGSAAAPTHAATLATTRPLVFAYVPADPLAGASHPSRAGAWLHLAGNGPDVRINSVTLYAYALRTATWQHITARIRFWTRSGAAGGPVFAGPVEFVVKMDACPCNFSAGHAYAVDVTLPKPVYSRGLYIGFSQLWETESGNGMPIVSRALVPALTRTPGSDDIGSTIAGYGNAGRVPDDLNFVQDDESAGMRLGLGLHGTKMTLDHCVGTSGFRDQFDEEFDNAWAFYQRWKAVPNFGTFSVGRGSVALHAPDAAERFPYLSTRPHVTMIPPTGDFEVRWLAQFDSEGASGDGQMVISSGTPLNGGPGDSFSGNLLRVWQDNDGYFAHVRDASGTMQTVNLGDGTTRHSLEYCWVGGKVELWLDGMSVYGPVDQPAARPDSLWFGNPQTLGDGPWNDETLYRVLVRGNDIVTSDLIFVDDFEPHGGTP